MRDRRVYRSADCRTQGDATASRFRSYDVNVTHGETKRGIPPCDLPFYQPAVGLLWGNYGTATFFLADDLEVVHRVTESHGAAAYEFIFGPLYDLPTGLPDESWQSVRALLKPEENPALPLMAICRLKIADYLLATWSRELRWVLYEEIQNRVRKRAAETPGGRAECVVLHCWSWPEVAVVVLANRPSLLMDAMSAIESLQVGEILGRLTEITDKDHWVPRMALGAWTTGRHKDVKMEEARDTLEGCHVFVTAHNHFGIHEKGLDLFWNQNKDAEKDLGSEVTEIVKRSFNLVRVRPPEKHEELQNTPYSDLVAGLSKSLRSIGEAPRFGARVRCMPRPGHLKPIWDHVNGELKNAGLNAVIRKTSVGEGIALEIDLRDTPEDWLRLLALSHWFRVNRDLSWHLQDVKTVLLDKDSPSEIARPFDPSENGGYHLLSSLRSAKTDEFVEKRMCIRSVGRAETHMLDSWIAATDSFLTRPEMYGALIHLASVARSIRTELLFIDSTNRNVAEAMRIWSKYGQRVLHQLLQSTPIAVGAPNRVELPYGVSQLVSMVHGVISVVMSLATHVETHANPSKKLRSSGDVLVSFGEEACIQVKGARHIGVVEMSILLALNPVGLCLTFHELGHWVIRSFKTWEDVDAWYQTNDTISYEILDALDDDATSSGEDGVDVELTQPRVKSFLEDIFAHITWRRLGCEDDWTLFQNQFLICRAMGLRSASPGLYMEDTISAWSEALVHLFLQSRLEIAERNPLEGSAMRRLMEDLRWICSPRADYRDPPSGVQPPAIDEKFLEEILSGDHPLSYLATKLGQFIRLPLFQALQEIANNAQPFAQGEVGSAICASNAAREVDNPPDVDKFQVIGRLAEASFQLCRRMLKGLLHKKTESRGEYILQMDELLDVLANLDGILADAKKDLEKRVDFQTIRSALKLNNPAILPPWDLFCQRGFPTERAFIWLREILKGIVDEIVNSPHARPDPGEADQYFSVCRGENHKYMKLAGKDQHGVFADYNRITFAAGRSYRSWYTRLRTVSLELLTDLAERVRAGKLARHFERERAFHRSDLSEQPVKFARLTDEKMFENPVLFEGYDICPNGLGLIVGPEYESYFKEKKRKTETVKVTCSDGKTRELEVRHVTELKDKRILVGLEFKNPDHMELEINWLAP